MKCKTCENLSIETSALTYEGEILRLAGKTAIERIHQLHEKLDRLMTTNEDRFFLLTDFFVKNS